MQKRRGGTGRYRSPYPSNANRMLYHVSYSPLELSPLLTLVVALLKERRPSSKKKKNQLAKPWKLNFIFSSKNDILKPQTVFKQFFCCRFPLTFERRKIERRTFDFEEEELVAWFSLAKKSKKKIRLSLKALLCASFFSPLLSLSNIKKKKKKKRE